MRFLLAIVTLSTVCPAVRGQDYRALRVRHGVTQPTPVAKIQKVVGERIFEVAGVVTGIISVGERDVLMLRATGGGDLAIEAESAPEWLTHGSVAARLLIQIQRDGPGRPMHLRLLGAAPEREVATISPCGHQPPKTRPKPIPVPSRGASRTTREWRLEGSRALPHYEDFILRRNPRLSAAEARRIAQGVIGFSLRYGVDARLIMAMVLVESGFDPFATSRKGAMGLGQLMPATARGLGVGDAYDSIENLYGAVRLVRAHLERYRAKTGDDFRSLVLTLAAYNAGPGAVRRHGGVPPYRETQNYIRRVLSAYRQMTGE